MTALQNEVATLRTDLAILANSKAAEDDDRLKQLEARIAKLETRRKKAMPAAASK